MSTHQIQLAVLLRVSPRGGRFSTRARVRGDLLHGVGCVAWFAVVLDSAGAGAGLEAGVGASIGTVNREDDDVSGGAPPGEPPPGEVPSDEESLDEACDSRLFFMKSGIC